MDIALILFGIQAVIRLAKAGKDAAEQHARDMEVVFPDIEDIHFDRRSFVNGFFNDTDYEKYVKPGTPCAQYWDVHRAKSDGISVDALFAAAVKIKADEGIDLKRWLSDVQGFAGTIFVKQWDPKKGPLSPFARVVMTAADIALEYIAVNPGIVGVGGNGEKIIGAYAQNLSELLPDDGNFGKNDQFAERLLGVFLRAGFETLGEHPDWVASEAHVAELISESVKPMLEKFPDDITKEVKWREAAEALAGPAASAAMRVLAEHSDQFFGEDFAAEKAMGALTKALLKQAAETGLSEQFTKDGLVDLYKAALGVAAKQPALFVGTQEKPAEKLAEQLIGNLAGVLMENPPPFDGATGVKLAAAAMDAVAANAHRFTDEDEPWEKVAADMVGELARDLSAAIASGSMEKVFSKDQLVDLGRIILEQASKTPGMIVGKDEALKQIAGAVAEAMKKDENLLLNGDDWLEIAQVAAREAAANPGRLFEIVDGDPSGTLAVKLIGAVLGGAGEILAKPDIMKKSVLFGQTLREAVIIVLHATSGIPAAAGKNLGQIEELVKDLNQLTAQFSDQLGSKEWLRLFRILLPTLLEEQPLGELTLDKANNLLKEAS